MLRTLLLATLALSLVALPLAAASHTGPCTHEPVDVLLAFEEYGLKGVLGLPGGCAQRTVDWVCGSMCVLP
jgi:hypothetical protein